MTNLRDSLKNNVLIADGAIGTLLKQHDHTHGHGPLLMLSTYHSLTKFVTII